MQGEKRNGKHQHWKYWKSTKQWRAQVTNISTGLRFTMRISTELVRKLYHMPSYLEVRKGGEYDANGKKEWQAPALEVLEVNQTMAGTGYRQIDWVTVHDADLYDPTS